MLHTISKSDIDKPFRLSGLFLAPDASTYLLHIVQRVEPSKRQKVLKRLVDTILKQKIDDSRITKLLCEQAVNDCKADHNVDLPVLFVIDAFTVPRFHYSQLLKKFVPVEDVLSGEEVHSLFPATAQLKSFLYANRYEVVHQHVLRHQLFSESAAKVGSAVAGSESYRIQPIEYLLSSGSRIDSAIILGMLCQLREGHWHLEDPTGILQLSLVGTTFHEGLFPEGCIVLLEGWYDEGVFHVTDMGLPPCEPSETSRRAFSTGNPFGGGPTAAAHDARMQRLLTTTQAGADAMLVLLGETRLDRPECMDKLAVLFAGYSAYPPVAFVLTGNFLSPESNGRSCAERLSTLCQLMRQLIVLFRNTFPDLDSNLNTTQPQLILVPGPEDPVAAPSNLLPQPGFPAELVLSSGLLDRRRDRESQPAWLHLASNPCRIRLYTREVVVFRGQYTKLLLRHCIHLPQGTNPEAIGNQDAVDTVDLDRDVTDSATQPTSNGSPVTQSDTPDLKPNNPEQLLGVGLARCLASQAHLLPLMTHIAPVYWAYDQALSLHPLPNLVVAVEPHALADLNATVEDPVKTGGCRFVNPGLFGQKVPDVTDGTSRWRTEYTFKVYYPHTGLVENSCLPE